MLTLLLGCHPTPPPTTTTTTTTATPASLIVIPPLAPPDLLIVQWARSSEPVVLDAAGDELALLPTPFGAGGQQGYAPAGGWDYGDYEIVALRDDPTEIHESFSVADYGEVPVPAESLVGRAWQITGVASPDGLDELALSEGTPVLRIDAVHGDQLDFTEIVLVGDTACAVLRDRTTYDPDTAHLSWSWPRQTFTVDADPEALPIDTWDLWAEATFVADGTRAAGRGHGVVDTRNVALATGLAGTWPMETCDLIGSFGAVCVPCPEGDDQATCKVEDPSHLTFEEIAPPADPLAVCGFDRIDVEPVTLSCNFEPIDLGTGCTCSTSPFVGGVPLVGLLIAVVRRRRVV